MGLTTTAWVLSVCAGITWAGCGTGVHATFPDEASCYRAIKNMYNSDQYQPVQENQNRRSMFAVCYPKQK